MAESIVVPPLSDLDRGSPARTGWIQLGMGAMVFCLSLLAVARAPNNPLFAARVVVTEWGHWLAIAFALMLGWLRSPDRRARAGGCFALLATVLVLSPVVRAMLLARTLPEQLTTTFGTSDLQTSRSEPLVTADLFCGVSTPDIQPHTVTYAAPEGHRLAMDIFEPVPAVQNPSPVVIVVHSGSWRNRDRTENASLNKYLAARGYMVAAIDYRLSPRWHFPSPRDDVASAVSYVKAHATELRADPSRLALVGRSAGGHLALLAGYASRDPAIRGIVAYYPMVDLARAYMYGATSRVLRVTPRSILEGFLGGPPDRIPDTYKAATPLHFVGSDTPPTLLLHGQGDDVVFPIESDDLSEQLARWKKPHFVVRMPWATHGCDSNFSGPCGQITTYAIERFLAAVMR